MTNELSSATLEAVARGRMILFRQRTRVVEMLGADLRTILDALTARTFDEGDVERVRLAIGRVTQDKAPDYAFSMILSYDEQTRLARAALAALQSEDQS